MFTFIHNTTDICFPRFIPIWCAKISYCNTKLNNNAPKLHLSFSVFKAKIKFSIPAEKDINMLDDTGTEVDEEVFSDILEEKSDIQWTIVDNLSVSGMWSFVQIVHFRFTLSISVHCNWLSITQLIRFSPVSCLNSIWILTEFIFDYLQN